MDENVKEVRTHRVGSITLGSAWFCLESCFWYICLCQY